MQIFAPINCSLIEPIFTGTDSDWNSFSIAKSNLVNLGWLILSLLLSYNSVKNTCFLNLFSRIFILLRKQHYIEEK